MVREEIEEAATAGPVMLPMRRVAQGRREHGLRAQDVADPSGGGHRRGLGERRREAEHETRHPDGPSPALLPDHGPTVG